MDLSHLRTIINDLGEKRDQLVNTMLITHDIDLAALDADLGSALARLGDLYSREKIPLITWASKKLTDQYLKRRFPLDWHSSNRFLESELGCISGRLGRVVAFNTPTLEIFPGQGEITRLIVAGEPLYLADPRQDLLDLVGHELGEYYRTRRLMRYRIKDGDFSHLPRDQFGLVCCISTNSTLETEVLIDIIDVAWCRLRPGGTLLLGYQPDTEPWAIELAEKRIYALHDEALLVERLNSLGYTDIDLHHERNRASTIMAIKPGYAPAITKAGAMRVKVLENQTSM
jgi:hypothetical protein